MKGATANMSMEENFRATHYIQCLPNEQEQPYLADGEFWNICNIRTYHTTEQIRKMCSPDVEILYIRESWRRHGLCLGRIECFFKETVKAFPELEAIERSDGSWWLLSVGDYYAEMRKEDSFWQRQRTQGHLPQIREEVADVYFPINMGGGSFLIGFMNKNGYPEEVKFDAKIGRPELTPAWMHFCSQNGYDPNAIEYVERESFSIAC